jgi:hypothetical protein
MRYEVEVCPEFDRVAWVTQQDWEALHQGKAARGHRGDAVRDAVIPICVDPDGR